MQSMTRRDFLETASLAAGAWMVGGGPLSAAIAPGVEVVAPPEITGEETALQPDVWALEIRFKPMRMIYVELTDPKTGKSAKELVWYIAYRAIARKNSRIPDTPEGAELRPMFVPEFTFVTEDGSAPKVYHDRVLPQAQAAINKRERYKYKNSVEIVGPLPAITPDGAKSFNSLDGVAMWTGIDPNTDFDTIYFTGFSNGYKKVPGPDGKMISLRRTLMQKFWRPSDRFDQNENEIRLKDDPTWIYR